MIIQHLKFALRQATRSSRQAVLFMVCVVLALAGVVAVNGFAESVNRSVDKDARTLHGADVIVRAYNGISGPVATRIDTLQRTGALAATRYLEFYSVVRALDDTASLLANIKIVEHAYPLYGSVRLQSGRPFHKVLQSGSTVVAQAVLDRLGLQVGQMLRVGYTDLTIADVVLLEPDRPVSFFSFGPRVFVSDADTAALGLVEKGSRIRHVMLLKLADAADIPAVAGELENLAAESGERVNTFRNARSRFKRFLDNFTFYLKLIGFFTLLISGLGMHATVSALLAEKKNTIAVMKTVGATRSYIQIHYLLVVLFLGVPGIIVGLLSGYLLQHGLATALAFVLPARPEITFSWHSVAEGIVLGVSVMIMFTLYPLHRLRKTRPADLFKAVSVNVASSTPAGTIHKRRRFVPRFVFSAFTIGLFAVILYWQLDNARISLWFSGAVIGLVIAVWGCVQFMLWVFNQIRPRSLALRQAVAGLFRRPAATRAVLVTVTASLSVLFAIFLIERNLYTTFVRSYPDDAPNLFFLDIQPSQKAAFAEAIHEAVTYYPIIRAKLSYINGAPVNRKAERKRRRDNLARTFSLTYRSALLPDERIVKGNALFQAEWAGPQVSVLDTVTEMREMRIGDMLTFNIQGVPLKARISSIRARRETTLSPYFYFVFQPEVLKDAPQTIFTALHVDAAGSGALQNRIAARFPNVSAIDVTTTIRVFSKLMQRLSVVVRLFGLLSIAAGVLILVSAVFATRAERMAESVYYKILGARRRFVWRVFAMENMLIGASAGFLAALVAQLNAWGVCRLVFEIDYHAFWGSSAVMVAAVTFFFMMIGLAASKSILDKKPAMFLREQIDA